MDSDLVFKGIDWDNFNTKLAEVKNGEHNNELPEEFREILAKKNSEDMPKDMPKEVEEMFEEKNKGKDKKDGNLSKVPEGLRDHVKKMQEKANILTTGILGVTGTTASTMITDATLNIDVASLTQTIVNILIGIITIYKLIKPKKKLNE